MKDLLAVKDASFSYDSKLKIFEEINFSISKGEKFCILGPNGTGKTTLLKCINGLMRLTEGKILLEGKDLYSLDHKFIAKKMGYIAQIHSSTFPFTVMDVVLMGRAPHLDIYSSPGEKDYIIAKNSMEALNIHHLKDKSYTEISGGEQQLVFLARVLTQEPNILLLDEPTSHLDFGNQMRTLNIINKLSKKGLAVVMSSHFPDQAFISADKVAIMKDNGFIDLGTPEAVINEENMLKTYGIHVDIIDLEKRRACIPVQIE